MQGGGPEKRGCRCWKSLLLHPTGGKERGIRGSEKGWRELKKSTSGGEGGESDQCWQLKSSDYNRREQRRGERMDQSSDGEYERREEKCRGSTAGWALRLSPGAQGTTAHSPTLSLTFFSHTFTSLFLSVWPRTLLGCRQPLAQPSFADSWDMIGWYSPALHCRWGTTSTPHTHTYTNQSDQNNTVLYSPSLSVDHHRACLLFNNASLTHICTETSMLQFIVQSSDLTHRKADFQTVGRFMQWGRNQLGIRNLKCYCTSQVSGAVLE